MLTSARIISLIVLNGLFQIGIQHRWVLVSVHHPRYQALQGRLVALRKTAGLSQVQMAERLGVGQSYISKIERGEAYVDVLIFVDWCQACGVTPGSTLDQLFSDQNR